MGNILIARAVPAIIAALIITFSANHSAVIGLAVFVGFGLIVAPIELLSIPYVGLESAPKIMMGIQAITTAVSAAVAAAIITQGFAALVIVMGTWAAVTAATELYAGYRWEDRAISRELLATGAFTALLAIVIAVIPLTEVYAVGIFGAYAAIIGVFQAIAGFSLRFDFRQKSEATS